MNENTPSMQPTLDEVRNQLESWRQTKRNHREPIPKKLWQAAVELSRQHSISIVSKELRLSYTNLKEHIPSVPKPKNIERDSGFIEINCDKAFSVPEATVEIEDTKGLKIRICFKGKPDFDLMNLARAFLEKNL
jgi:hypothetical protein